MNSETLMGNFSPFKLEEKVSKRKIVIEDVITKDADKAEPCLVQFSNGIVKRNESIKGRLYKNVSEKYVRRRKERMLKMSSSHLSYVGKNFGEDVANDYKERLFLGVLENGTNKMRLIEMSSFLVHPEVNPGTSVNESIVSAQKTFKEKRWMLNESFGGRKARSLIRKRKDDEFNIEDMSEALNDALETVPVGEVPENSKSENSYSHILPPCNRESDNICDVYPLESIVTDEELVTFNDEAMEWLEGQKEQSGCSPLFSQTLANAKLVPEEEEAAQAKLVCVALFTEKLIQLLQKKPREKLSLKPCPKVIERKIFNSFTEGGGQRRKTKSLEDKLIAYIIIVALIVNKYEVEWSTLSRSLGIKKDRFEDLVRVVGATVVKGSGSVVLKRPLIKMPFQRRKKRTSTFFQGK